MRANARLDDLRRSGWRSWTRFTAGVFTALYAVTLLVQLRIGRKMPLGSQVLLSVLVGAILLAKISLLGLCERRLRHFFEQLDL